MTKCRITTVCALTGKASTKQFRDKRMAVEEYENACLHMGSFVFVVFGELTVTDFRDPLFKATACRQSATASMLPHHPGRA